MSRSAILTFQPAAAYSRATRRARVLLPTPPFWETIQRKIAMIDVHVITKARKHASTINGRDRALPTCVVREAHKTVTAWGCMAWIPEREPCAWWMVRRSLFQSQLGR